MHAQHGRAVGGVIRGPVRGAQGGVGPSADNVLLGFGGGEGSGTGSLADSGWW